jgi:drug/metabolite transporter (DMT)-like permease
MFARYKYHLLLHIIIFMWGFTGILGKVIQLDAVVIVWHRVLIAMVALGIALLILKKPIKLSSRKELLKLSGVGVIVALHWVTFYQSIQLSTASLGILCLSTTTLHVAWLEPLVMKRPFSWVEFALGLLVICGIYFVSRDFDASDMKALAYGLCSALFAALFSVFNGKLVQQTPAHQITLIEMVSAFVVISVYLLYIGRLDTSLFTMRVADFLWLLFLGILCTSFAFLATIEVVKRLGAFTVSLSINLEPVYTIVLAIFILGEHELLNPSFYIGSIVIVLVIILNGLIRHYLKPAPTKSVNQ